MEPIIKESLYPFGNWHSSNVPTLPDQIDDGPMVLSTLKVIEGKVRQLATSQTTTQQDCDDCTISLALERLGIGKLPESTSLICREPISQSHSELLQSLHATDAGGKFGAQQSCIGRLVG
jgi:hypothetical protein